MNEHARFASLAGASLDFPLTPAERAELDQHGATCVECRALAAAYRMDADALRSIAYAHTPDRVWIALSAALSRTRPRVLRWELLLAAALVGAALLGALVIVGAQPPSLLADASPAPSTSRSATAAPTRAAAPTDIAGPTFIGPPTAEPAASPAPVPTVETSTPSATPSEGVSAVQLPIGLQAIVLTDRLRIRTEPSVEDPTTQIALLDAGTTFTLARGPVLASGYWWYMVEDVSTSLGAATGGWVAAADRDGTAWIGASPRSCEGWTFSEEPISVRSLADLQHGIVATWMGCVTTPWIPPQWATLTFRSDGTYASAVVPHPEGGGNPAFYYGSDGDSPTRRYWLTDLQDSLNGIGEIDIVFDDGSGSIVRDELRNIRLMGDRLDFDFFHFAQYGPVTFRLYRIIPS